MVIGVSRKVGRVAAHICYCCPPPRRIFVGRVRPTVLIATRYLHFYVIQYLLVLDFKSDVVLVSRYSRRN